MKGQLQIQESIVISLFVLIIVLIGFLFFYKYTLASIEKQNFEYEYGKFNDLLVTIPHMNELQCSFLQKEEECVDILKLISFKEISTEYSSFFGTKKIFIERVYPLQNSRECSYANLDECGKFILYSKIPKKYSNKLIVSSPLSLYDPRTKEYSVGRLVIEWYL